MVAPNQRLTRRTLTFAVARQKLCKLYLSIVDFAQSKRTSEPCNMGPTLEAISTWGARRSLVPLLLFTAEEFEQASALLGAQACNEGNEGLGRGRGATIGATAGLCRRKCLWGITCDRSLSGLQPGGCRFDPLRLHLTPIRDRGFQHVVSLTSFLSNLNIPVTSRGILPEFCGFFVCETPS